MNELARELRDNSNCAVDYANDNPQVLQAYNGLVAYYPLYQASCLRDGDGRYCESAPIDCPFALADRSMPQVTPMLSPTRLLPQTRIRTISLSG
jgi:hypothetical protein